MQSQRQSRRFIRSAFTRRGTSAALLIAAASVATAQGGLWINPLGGAWNVGSNWDTGVVPNGPMAIAEIGVKGAYEVVLPGGVTTLGELLLTNPDAVLTLPAGTTLSLSGGTGTVNGTLQINNFSASGFSATLNATADTEFIGPGTTRLAGISTTRAQITTSGEAVVTIAPEHTVAGGGRILASLVNNGAIIADETGLVLQFSASATTNNGLLAASNGGTLSFTSIAIDQTGGGQILADGPDSLVEFTSNGSVLGGSLDTTPDAPAMVRQSGTTTLEDITLDGELLVVAGGNINLTGTAFTNDGLLSLNDFNASGFSANLSPIDSVSLLGSGTVRLNGLSTTRAQILNGGGVLTNSATHTIAGAGRILSGFINDGLIDADTPEFQFQIETNNAVNNGTIRVSGGGLLNITNSIIDQTGGGQILADGPDSLVEFIGVGSVLGGSLDATPDAPAMVRQSGTTTLNGVENNARVTIVAGGTVNIADTVFTNNNRINIGNFSSSGFVPTLNFLAADATVTGSGEIAFSKPSGGTPRIQGAGVLTNDIDHTISGRGQVFLGLNNTGIIKPGDPTGTITVSGGYTAAAGSVHHITINDAVDFSRIEATGPLDVDGDIVLSIDSGFLPPVGSSYSIITGSSATGTMTVIDAPQIGRLVFNAVTLSDRVDIAVTVCADLNDDGIVDTVDLGLLLGGFGGSDVGDINGDGLVDTVDLGLLLGGFGSQCGG